MSLFWKPRAAAHGGWHKEERKQCSSDDFNKIEFVTFCNFILASDLPVI